MIVVKEDVAAFHKAKGWDGLSGDFVRDIPGDGHVLFFLALWVSESGEIKCIRDPDPVIGGKDEVRETFDGRDGINCEAKMFVSVFERLPLAFGVLRVDFVIDIHPRVDGVLDGKVVGRRHDNSDWFGHTRRSIILRCRMRGIWRLLGEYLRLISQNLLM